MTKHTLSNLEFVAEAFKGSTCDRARLHARPGLLVATDGRVHIRIESPLVEAIPNSNDRYLDFEPEEGTRIAGREWIEKKLRPTVLLADSYDGIKFTEMHSEFMRELERDAATCPCCRSRLVITDDKELEEYDDFLKYNAPERKSSCSAIGLHFARPPRNMFFGTFYLAIAIHAADELGGADELLCGRQQLIFKGDGFRIVIMNLRDPGTDVRTIDVPDVEGGAV
jgi:hypothetical protein